MFIDIPSYSFEEETETFDLDKVNIIGFNTNHITEVAVVKDSRFKNVWVLVFKILGEEEKKALAFPNEEEPIKIKTEIYAAENRYIKDFRKVL